jgi:hypothetical protein
VRQAGLIRVERRRYTALVECARRLNGVGKDQSLVATDFLVRRFIGARGELIGQQKPIEWAIGESLIALDAACSSYRAHCESIGVLLDYLEAHVHGGILASDSPRFHSWLAAGLARIAASGLEPPPHRTKGGS